MSTTIAPISQPVARERLCSWREVARWIDYSAAEFTADQTSRSYLEHVAQCVRDEGERRYAEPAGFDPALSTLEARTGHGSRPTTA